MSATLEPAPRAAGEPQPSQTGKPVLNSVLLRQIAEYASGERGDRFWIVVTQNPEGGYQFRQVNTDPGHPDDGVVIPCGTLDDTRPPLEHAVLKAKHACEVDLLNMVDEKGHPLGPADSVFWSSSAAEKFLVPYYASVYGGCAGEAVAILLNIFEGAPYPTAESVQALGEDLQPEVTKVQAYGLVHLPRSEYIELEDTSSTTAALAEDAAAKRVDPDPGARLAVLGIDHTGKHRVIRFRDLLRAQGR